MDTNKQNWFEKNPKKAKFLLFLIVILVLELSVRLLVFLNYAPYHRYPTAEAPVFWDDINENFGVWHYPNKEFRHKTSCFDVTYRSNSYGARDSERSIQSEAPRRVVVLGDSYVEGFGIARGKRFSDILENETGIEHLNFGTSGSFGTIQEWLLYDSMASKFDHTDIMVFILPANDFSDNNPEDFPATRFRPYLRENSGSFEVYYPVSFQNRQRIFRDWELIIKNTFHNASYLANFLRYAVREIKKSLKGEEINAPPQIREAHYNSYSQNELNIMLFSLHKIAERAQKRNVFLYTIPSAEDYTWARENGYNFSIIQELHRFAESQSNIHFQDLLPDFLNFAQANDLTYADFTHGCDAHWNDLGNRVVAEIILKKGAIK